MLASWFRILWGDGLPAQALIMDTRLPNIEHGGAGGQTLKRLALFLCFPNFASHVRTHQMTSFLSGFTKYGAWGCLGDLAVAAQWPPSGRPVAAPVAAQWPPTNNMVF